LDEETRVTGKQQLNGMLTLVFSADCEMSEPRQLPDRIQA
jgi:hypothetical protein